MGRRVHVESRAYDALATSATAASAASVASAASAASEVASAFVRALGWQPPAEWTEIEREEAVEVVSSALMNNLVDDAPMMPFREAEATARQFVSSCDERAVFFTNGALADTRRGFGRRPITKATADAGVIAVWDGHVALLWVEDAR
jgi:hypothetical protein